MSVHNACGVEIRWADRDVHRVHPPLEYIGNAYIVGSDNIVRNVATYKIHVCDPEQIAAWTRLRSEAQAQREAYEMTRDQFNEIAMQRDCPRCHAPAKTMCWNLHEQAKGNMVPVKWCHPERAPASTTAVDPEELD